MIKVAASVENNVGDAFFDGSLGDGFADLFSSLFVAARHAEIFFGAGGRHKGDTLGVIDDLSVDVIVGAINAESRAFSGAADLCSDSLMSLQTSLIRIFSCYHLCPLLSIIYRSYRPYGEFFRQRI